MDTSGYQVPNQEDIELDQELIDSKMGATFRPGVDTFFSPSTFNHFEIGSIAESPNLIDKDQVKENSSSFSTSLVSERPT